MTTKLATALIALTIFLAACSGGSETITSSGAEPPDTATPDSATPDSATPDSATPDSATPGVVQVADVDHPGPGVTREQALAFCAASNGVQTSLAQLAEAADFTASVQAADTAVVAWTATIPNELLPAAAPVLDGWATTVETFTASQDRTATLQALGQLVTSTDYQTAIAEFRTFAEDQCSGGITTEDDATAATGQAPTPEPQIEAPAENEPAPFESAGGSVTTAPLEFTAEQCNFPEGHLIGANAADHFSSIAVVEDSVFLTGQEGDADTGLIKYTQADGTGCTLVAETSFGTGGVLHLDDPIDFVSASSNGRLAASNTIFGTWGVDAATGTSVSCPRGAYTDISPDGRFGFGHFPGTGDLSWYEFTSDTCDHTSAAVTVGSQPNVTQGAWIGDALYVVGGFLPDGGAGVTAINAQGVERWSAGGSPAEFGDAGYGAISAISPCAGYVCVVDSNFRQLHVLDPADGWQLAVIDLQELTGLPINWINGLAEGSDNTLWLAGGIAQRFGNGNPSDQVQGVVFRITVRA